MPPPAKNTKSCSNYYPPDPARTLHGRSRLPRLLESARPAGIRTAARRGLPRRSRGGSKDGMPEGFLDDFQEGANIRLNVARRTRASGTTSRVRHEPATQRKGRGRSRRGHTRRAVGCHDRRGARSTGQAARSEFESSSVNTQFARGLPLPDGKSGTPEISITVSARIPNEGYARVPI
jgi:hypothetical protein